MRKLFTFISLIAISTSIFAQTPVNGNQTGTWTAANSPYQVTGEILVPGGQTLTIEAGVEVDFQGHYKFTVQGNLQALGTETDSIFFTTENQTTGWGGIRFDGSDGISNLSYCRIEYGKTSGNYPDIHGGGMALLTSDAVVSNCVFADNEATGNDDGMGGAVYAINTGSPSATLTRFTDCKFINNHAYGEGGAIKFTSDMNTEISGCEFIDNSCNYGGGAISFYSVIDTKMIFCLFADNSTMYSSGGAIHTLGFDNSLIFEQCTMSGNSAPGGDGGAVNLVWANANFVNSIIYDNPGAYSNDIYIDMGGSAEINYCDLTMPSGATGSNNINENPQFVDPDSYDFRLLEISQCIDAGIDIGYEYVGEAPDMGCYEYNPSIGTNNFQSNSFSIFPNPTNGKIMFEFTGNRIQKVKISDLTGKTIIEKPEPQQNGIIDLSGFESGIYFISIQTDEEIFTTKILKE
ncbi:MAG: hypothetical protein B6D61_03200 [Bacteroidetes bacterium 4484_249]|nr:MAG: hypothetical protein B6D61_03200 [Bacteroidetes bacterium 4484_249]